MTVPLLDRRRFIVATCALPLVEACAPLASRDPNAPADVAIVSLPIPAKLSLTIEKHPDTSTSIARALLFAGDVEKGVYLLTDALRSEPSAGEQFLATLVATSERELADTLRRRGKTVTIAPYRDRIEFVSSYPALNARAERIVDVIPRALGYWSEYPARIYRPWVRLEYRIFDARTARNVATGFIGTGGPPQEGQWTLVDAGERYAFETFEALVAEPVRAAEGLRVTVARVAQALAGML